MDSAPLIHKTPLIPVHTRSNSADSELSNVSGIFTPASVANHIDQLSRCFVGSICFGAKFAFRINLHLTGTGVDLFLTGCSRQKVTELICF